VERRRRREELGSEESCCRHRRLSSNEKKRPRTSQNEEYIQPVCGRTLAAASLQLMEKEKRLLKIYALNNHNNNKKKFPLGLLLRIKNNNKPLTYLLYDTSLFSQIGPLTFPALIARA
jgi:hypothetical protein